MIKRNACAPFSFQAAFLDQRALSARRQPAARSNNESANGIDPAVLRIAMSAHF
jgi:hypothetical protein